MRTRTHTRLIGAVAQLWTIAIVNMHIWLFCLIYAAGPQCIMRVKAADSGLMTLVRLLAPVSSRTVL